MRLNSALDTATFGRKITAIMLAAIAITVAAPAWASHHPAHKVRHTPKPHRVPAHANAGQETTLMRVENKAMSLIGVRYRSGGNSPVSGFDCSGFVQYVLREAAGLRLPHSAASQATAGQQVDRDDLRKGDLVFFQTFGHGISHVGLYLGHGEFIHAPSSGKRVRVENFNTPYWQRRYLRAARLSAVGGAAPAVTADG